MAYDYTELTLLLKGVIFVVGWDCNLSYLLVYDMTVYVSCDDILHKCPFI